jgi:hypothetical protein
MKKINLITYAGCIVTACACMTENAAQAADTNQTITVRSDMFISDKSHGQSISSIFAAHLQEAGTTGLRNNFGPRSDLPWIENLDRGYAVVEQWNKSGQNAVGNAAGYALQETAMYYLRVDELEEETEGRCSRVFVRIFEGSFADTVGERATDLSTIPSYVVEEVSLMEYMSDGVNGGYRLLRKNPYLYADTGFGRHSDGRRLALIGFRCYSRLMDKRHIGIPEVEPHIIVLLPKNWNLQGGASFYPTRFGSEGYRPTWSVGIDHIVSKRLPLDIAIGYSGSANDQGVLFSIAYEF